MAIKYLCDGCDKEVPYDQILRVTTRVEVEGPTVGEGGQFEMCKSCLSNMKSQINPKNWTRCHPPVMKRAM